MQPPTLFRFLRSPTRYARSFGCGERTGAPKAVIRLTTESGIRPERTWEQKAKANESVAAAGSFFHRFAPSDEHHKIDALVRGWRNPQDE